MIEVFKKYTNVGVVIGLLMYMAWFISQPLHKNRISSSMKMAWRSRATHKQALKANHYVNKAGAESIAYQTNSSLLLAVATNTV